MPLYNNLKDYMRLHDIRQQSVADCMGVTRQAISRLVKNPPTYGLQKLSDLCDVFQCQPSDLIQWTPPAAEPAAPP